MESNLDKWKGCFTVVLVTAETSFKEPPMPSRPARPLLVVLLFGLPFSVLADGQLYTGFTLIDPVAVTRTPGSWLIVRDGLIAQVGSGLPPAGDYQRRDMAGLYAMPGLIDAHGHLTAGPQRVTLVDGKPQVEIVTGDEFSRGNAAIALAFGVTSVRDPGGSAAAAARYDQMVASGQWLGPEARHAGEILQPPPFIGQSFAYPRNTAEWDAEASRQAAAGMTYFKLYTDLSENDLAMGVKAAKKHGLIPIAHLNHVSWLRALELGVEQFEHAMPTSPALLEPAVRDQYQFGPDYLTRWWELADLDGPLVRELVEQLVRADAKVDLTLMVNELLYFSDEWETRFPEFAGEMPDYIHPEHIASLTPSYAAMRAVAPDQLARSKRVWPKVLAFAKRLHDAGAALMIGTDGTGGAGLHYEMANHVKAGIPTWEVLRMATSGNAALMDLTDTGRILPGKQADIVFLRADPVANVSNVKEVAHVINNGMFHESTQLLDIARSIARAARARMEANGK
jgi:imidazolonepropionase-like amidohydrolase